MLDTLNQWIIFLYMLYGGILCGCFYDFFRALRLELCCNKWGTAVLDGLFCLSIFPVVTWLFFQANYLLPFYWMFLSVALGTGIYFLGPSYFLFTLLRKLIHWILMIRETRLWKRLFR